MFFDTLSTTRSSIVAIAASETCPLIPRRRSDTTAGEELARLFDRPPRSRQGAEKLLKLPGRIPLPSGHHPSRVPSASVGGHLEPPQAGVERLEAVAATWSRWALVMAYAG